MSEPSNALNSRALLAAGAVALAVSPLLTGCGHSDSSDAPYGAAASPSGAASPAGSTVVAAASPAASPSPAASSSGASDPVVPVVAPPGTQAPGAPLAGGPMSGAPMMGMGSSPTAPLSPTPDLDAKIASAEKSGNKKAIAAAYAERGTFRENDEHAGARVKYRAALQDFRKALAADPNNVEAKTNKDEIESIYKQMGRPIPE